VLLKEFGWNDFFSSQLAGGAVGRVASANHGRFLVWTEAGDVDASVSGLLRRSSPIWPAVGDWVVLREDAEVIVKVLERKTKLSRKQPEREVREQVLAANIDVLFIVSGLDRDYNERRIERFLVMAQESGARPVVLLNKADLAGELGLDLDEVVSRTRKLCPGVTVAPLSAKSDHGLDALPAFLALGGGQVHDPQSAAGR
jgi:ribosome biogenesis GTPase